MSSRAARNKKRGGRRPRQQKEPSLASLAMQGVSRIMKLINIEEKFYITASAGSSPTYNGILQDLCSPAQGASVNQRIGDSIKMQRITIRASFYLGAVATTVRAILLMDKANQAATGADILAGAGSVYAPQSTIVDQLEERYHILGDTGHVTLTLNGNQSHDWSWNISNETLARTNAEGHILFTPASTTITTNSLKLLLISSVNASMPNCYYYSKVEYTDD